MMKTIHIAASIAASIAAAAGIGICETRAAEKRQPNVILIMTDDQGYGEISAHGNPVLKTPNLDTLHGESVRLTDFHVDPTCSPTRAALMTGRYSTRTGVWHTINGRSMLRPDELTLAELFRANGYDTAMIGKWHMGDNFPCRPQDQGFAHTVWHLGGGIGNGPDFWGNDYYDDTYLVNGKREKFEGYCTDVWFREAASYVERNKDKPFFLYLAPNAPHGPYFVPDRYSAPYIAAGLPETMAKFYGMIANIDENMGSFRAHLAKLGLAENTLLIFMTDNGTTAGWIDQGAGYEYFNAGMRGWKSSAWDGGHRVPCFWHWPAGKLEGGRDVPQLTAHIDVLPTLADLLGLEKPDGPAIDGVSLKANLLGGDAALPERTIFAHVQRAFLPPKWENSVAMNRKWRLIDGKELYDIAADPGQKKDIAAAHPEVAQRLRADYETWWASLKPAMDHTVRYVLGGEENPMTLASHDWLMPGVEQAAWHQNQIKRGDPIKGPWAVDVKQAGTYAITLRLWPDYLEKAMHVTEARLAVAGVEETIAVKPEATAASFRVTLPAGPTMLETTLIRADGKQSGAYFARIELTGDAAKE
ncbi:arylsulfatase [Akkermansiaceae bacterium]|nr:arylsulfatase [Akkermansiaceae bacterium]